MAKTTTKKNKGGRPKVKKSISATVKNKYIAAAEKLAKEHGVTLEYQMLSMIFDSNIQDTVKASIMKTYNDAMIIRESESKIIKEDRTPKIYLPEEDEDQGLTVVRGGKKN